MAEQFEKYIGKYGVLALIGEGGMGHIYKAVDPRIRRTVAIKTVRTAGIHEAKLAEFKERFFREAEICGRLHHPNIVTLFEMDQDPKTNDLFIAMEFIDGSPLSAYTQSRTEMDIKLKLRLLSQAASGLDHAHKQGVVHRDVKPSNILISKTGEAKITDFGIAKVAESDLPQVTRTDTFLGSPRYSSPEQVRGSGVDARSDIFSFGIMTYEFLVGINPFAGSNLSESLYKIAQCLPNLTHENEHLNYPNDRVRDIFRRVLHAEQNQRYQSVSSFIRELESAVLEATPSAHLGQSELHKHAVGSGEAMAKTAQMPVVDSAITDATGGSSSGEAMHDTSGATVSGEAEQQPPARRDFTASSRQHTREKSLLIKIIGAVATVIVVLLIGFFWLGGKESAPPAVELAKNSETPAVADGDISEAMPEGGANAEAVDAGNTETLSNRPLLDLGATTPVEEISLKRDLFLYLVNAGELEQAARLVAELESAGASVEAEQILLQDVRENLALETERGSLLAKFERGQTAENLATMNAALREYRRLFPEETVLPEAWQMEIRKLEDQFRPKASSAQASQPVKKRSVVVSPDQGFLDRIDTPMRQGRFDLAEQTLAAGLSAFAGHPEIQWRAGFLAFQKREFDKAAAYFEPLVESEHETGRTIAREFFANYAFLHGDFEQSQRWYDELSTNLLTMTEKHQKEWVGLQALNHIKEDQLFGLVWQDHAIDPKSLDSSRWTNRRRAGDIDDLLEEHPEWLLSAAVLTDFYRLNGQKRKAEKVLERMKSQFENHYYYQETVAAYHYRTGEYQEVVQRFKDVIYPSPRLKYLLGLCYFKLGDKVKARQLLLDLNASDYPDISKLRQSL